jgi:uncharacterized protein YuzE
MSKQRYLKISYRDGRAMAGYLYLPRREGDRVEYSKEVGDDFVIDFTADDRAIGIEILSPAHVSASAINALLKEVGQEPMTAQELSPLVEKAIA